MRKTFTFLCFALALAMLPSAASAAAVEPVPGGPSVFMDSQFSIGGKAVGRDDAAKRGYACIDDAAAVARCYADRKTLATAENVRIPGVSIASKRHHRGARAARHPGNPLILSMGPNNTGAAIGVYVYCTWYNLTGSWNDNAESGYSGNHSAILQDYWSGYGPQIASSGAYTTWTTFGGGANRTSSAWRYG